MLLSLLACFGPADWTDVSLEDACELSDPGYEDPSDAALEALDRANCYRSLLGLEPGVLEERLDAASQAHAEYMDGEGVLAHAEDPEVEGFTGEQVWDRIAAAGWDDQVGLLISEVVAEGPEPAAAVDLWVDSVYHRSPFTAPEWVAAGFGSAGAYSSMAFVMPYPQQRDVAVAYPVNGQVDVPTSFDSDTESPDPAPGHGVVGYPVTVSVSSTDAESGLRLDSGQIRGPGGAIDVIELDPTNDESLYDMVALVPTEPLEPGTAYEAELGVSWGGERQTLEIHFETRE